MAQYITINLKKDVIVMKLSEKATQADTIKSLKKKLPELKKLYQQEKTPIFVTGRILKNKELKEIQGEQKEIAWGSQIRSYVLHPYSLVKDNRSLYESNNPKDVLDGNLDDFIYAYLKSSLKEGKDE